MFLALTRLNSPLPARKFILFVKRSTIRMFRNLSFDLFESYNLYPTPSFVFPQLFYYSLYLYYFSISFKKNKVLLSNIYLEKMRKYNTFFYNII